MNFVRYDPQTGAIVVYGQMEDIYVQQEIDEGKPTMFAQNIYDFNWKVDLTTMQIVPKTPEEIAADQPKPIEIPAPTMETPQ